MINTIRLRCTIGWLGMLLPWIVLIMSNIYGYGFPDSISATYYIPTCITPFMIILGSAGLLLFSYKGYENTMILYVQLPAYLHLVFVYSLVESKI